MKIEFDPGKDIANQRKHGLSLMEAEHMNLDTALYAPDHRFNYGENRTRALGLISGRLHMLVFTMRGDMLRVISLRKANLKEAKRYDEEA